MIRIRIITSCTGEKRHKPKNTLTQDDFLKTSGLEAFIKREQELAEYSASAEEMYTGLQHIRLLDGMNSYREQHGGDSLELWVLSAGYGIISGNQQIAPYECTFQGMKPLALKDWSSQLGIPTAARKVFASPADLTLVLLGDDYLKALQLDEEVCFGSPTIFLTSEGAKKQIKGQGTFLKIPLTNKDAKRFSCGLVGVKGEVTKRLLRRLATEGETFFKSLLTPDADILAMLETPIEAKPVIKRAAAHSNPDVDHVISIPSSWWEKPHRAKLRYFIPEWDDTVDPNFDFLTDTHSGGSTDWSNETYAHQMYPEPNYDGILISKVVAEKTVKKRERINALGVHRFLRVPREFPIMGTVARLAISWKISLPIPLLKFWITTRDSDLTMASRLTT